MEGLSHYQKDERPWGNFERFILNESATVKILTVNANEAFSLQTHKGRAEFWRVLSGSGTVTIGEEKKAARAGDNFFIPKGAPHRFEAGETPCIFLEISLGAFAEDDIIRMEDKYGRA